MKEKVKKIGQIALSILCIFCVIFYLWLCLNVINAIPGSRMF